ncbi:MAG TPA: serine/threonine-protein kinase [Gammaproteobacteria bacterium]|nr:serine/threonine-protein kinase [Gammaproteobacteria bacterium]
MRVEEATAPALEPVNHRGGVPERIGKYPIIKEIGHGSSGRVFLSHDPYYGRDVAIKLYNVDQGEDEQKARTTRKMFFTEAQMMGRLQHPNILPVYDAGEQDGSYYVVTENIQGARTLAAYCRPDNLLRIDDVIEILYKCARALHYAHGRGVIHRDIKPSNIMLTLDNDVRIIDFGIALVTDSDVSRIEGIAGSPSYMSPEQIQAGEITATSDLYSLGVVLYELLTGFRPFRANNLSKLLHQIVYATAPPIHTVRAEVPEEIEEIVATALRKEADQRYSSGLELAGALTSVFHDLRARHKQIDQQEQFNTLRRLSFFHDFSHEEIREIMRASEWRDYAEGDEIIREGEMDDRFYVIVSGSVGVESGRRSVGEMSIGDCFGETSYVSGARRTATIIARTPVTLIRVSSTLLEQASSDCQLRFNKVFLRSLIERLQGVETAPST